MKYDFAHPKFRNGQITFDAKEKPLIDIFREQAIRNRMMFRDMVLYNNGEKICRIRNWGHALEVIIDMKSKWLRSKGDIMLFFNDMKNESFYNEDVEPLNEALKDPDTGDVFEKDNVALQKYFKLFNDKYFGGQLAEIPLRWFKGTGVHGTFSHRTDLQAKKIIPVEIKLNINASGTFAAFRNVFVHEMLHYYVDVYIGLPEVNWERAKWCAFHCDRRGLKTALRSTQETCHAFEWKRLADELSAKYPELGNIEKYAVHNAETGVAQYDQKFILNWAEKNIMLKRVNDGMTKYYVISASSPVYNKFTALFAQGVTHDPILAGTWYRLYPSLNPAQFELLRATRDFYKYYPKIPESMVRKEKELGTLKISNY